MKLKIIEYFWGVGRKTRRNASYRMPLREGEVKDVDRLQFEIRKVEDGRVTVSLNRKDKTPIKEFTVENGKAYYYRPMSMDGGVEYVVKLTKLF